MDLSKFLDIAEKVLTLILLVGGAIGFLFRAWVTEWIKNRFARAVSKELENQKHQLNVELESYKASLMRELEEFKANIDIRRSVALKMADIRLDVLRTLSTALARFTNEGCTWPKLTMQLRQHSIGEFNDAVKTIRDAQREAEIFLTHDLIVELSTYVSDVLQFVHEYPIDVNNIIQEGDERLSALIIKNAEVANKIRELIYSAPAGTTLIFSLV